tara:strand:- start:541 stop:1548 length:1008 start_codon:yes stop_codon:yes gene_type:complete
MSKATRRENRKLRKRQERRARANRKKQLKLVRKHKAVGSPWEGPVTANVNCMGKRHRISLRWNGDLFLHDHQEVTDGVSEEDLIAGLLGLAGETNTGICRCYQIRDAWRAHFPNGKNYPGIGRHNQKRSDIPAPLIRGAKVLREELQAHREAAQAIVPKWGDYASIRYGRGSAHARVLWMRSQGQRKFQFHKRTFLYSLPGNFQGDGLRDAANKSFPDKEVSGHWPTVKKYFHAFNTEGTRVVVLEELGGGLVVYKEPVERMYRHPGTGRRVFNWRYKIGTPTPASVAVENNYEHGGHWPKAGTQLGYLGEAQFRRRYPESGEVLGWRITEVKHG